MSIQFDTPLQILLSMQKVFYHDLKNNVKDLAASGLLILYTGRIRGKEILSIRIGHLIMNLTDQLTIVKCEYESVIIYYLVVVSNDLVSSITIDKENEERGKFESYLRNHCKTLEAQDLEQNRQVNDVIDGNWTGFLIKPVVVPDAVQRIISSAGSGMERGIVKLSGKIREYYQNHKKKREEAVNPRNIEVEPQGQYAQHVEDVVVDDQSQQQPRPQPQIEQPQPSKFKKFMSALGTGFGKASKVFNKVSTPIVKKGRELNDRVCAKIDQSDSKVLKYMKDFAAVTNDALSNAYSGIQSGFSNKETLYITYASKDIVIDNPELQESQEAAGALEERREAPQIDVTAGGLHDSLLNKDSYEQSLQTPYEERI